MSWLSIRWLRVRVPSAPLRSTKNLRLPAFNFVPPRAPTPDSVTGERCHENLGNGSRKFLKIPCEGGKLLSPKLPSANRLGQSSGTAGRFSFAHRLVPARSVRRPDCCNM